jgi:hypothetical protein
VNRKPIFDAVRAILGRGFRRSEIEELDRACALAFAGGAPPHDDPGHRLGSLSEKFESGSRGPGAVSGGRDDAGGVSYGVYQLASKTGTCGDFVNSEGARWADRFGSLAPGSARFSAVWKAIAEEDPEGFRAAQHAFIERTHYRPAVNAVRARTGLDLDSRSPAVRDATWSCAVQHGGAARILSDAIARVDRESDRASSGYDRALIEAIYDRRTSYVLGVAENSRLPPGTRRQLVAITRARYPAERSRALAMLSGEQPFEIKSMLALRSKPRAAAFGAKAIGERS